MFPTPRRSNSEESGVIILEISICACFCSRIRQNTKFVKYLISFQTSLKVISFLYDFMVNIKLKYNFVETPRKFIIAELSIRKLGSSSALLALMRFRAYGSKALR